MSDRTALRRASTLLAAAALGLFLTACGDSPEDGNAGESSELQTAGNGDVFNDADVEFATGMIPHHAQAIQMTVLAQGRPLDPPVQALVEQIRATQVPEVELMSDWLTAWDHEVPETSLDHANAGHDMDHMGDDMPTSDMPGMMSQEQMDRLEAATDAEFQDLWLEMMIEHHQGAIEMAQAEQQHGEFPDAVALAKSIESSQTAEIKAIEGLLG